MKLVIEKLTRTDKNKEGQPLVNKQGKSYTRLSICAGGVWYSAFGGTWNDSWKVGDTIEVKVTENGQYKNIEAPKATDSLEANIKDLQERVKHLEYLLKVSDNDRINF